MLTYEEMLAAAEQLSPLERLHLIETLLESLKPALEPVTPLKSLYGLCADLGSAPSAEEIDEVRREMWKNFPREDI